MKRALLIGLLTLVATMAWGHEARPGYLGIRQVAEETYEVRWKVPAKGEMKLGIYARLPEICQPTRPPSRYLTGGAYTEISNVECPGGLTGQSIHIEGLSGTLTDVLVRFERADGSTQSEILTPASPTLTIAETAGWTSVAFSYLELGVEHILGGFDHLLFVLALLILVTGWQRLLLTVTAFTVAHSVTLALATLGWVHAPPAPVEAVIALSILFLACEIVRSRRGKPGLTEREPWIVAFVFGLLHGFGFAGALSEVGLPEHAIPLALFFFNVGVEVGQLLFVAGALLLLGLASRIEMRPRWLGDRLDPRWGWQVPTYAIGALAAFWTLQRVSSFWA